MTKTKTYRFISGNHTHTDGKKYAAGDTIELSPRMARFLVNKVRPAEVVKAAPAPTPEPAPVQFQNRNEIMEALDTLGVKYTKKDSAEDLFAAWQLATAE